MPTIVQLQRANHGGHFRAFGLRGVARLIDPFLGVDHAWMGGPTFPPHAHAGFSAVSYVFLDSETGLANRDSLGTNNLIQPGGLHWATAGSGMVHEEVPAEPGKTVHSLQIFVNLAPPLRQVAPSVLSLEPLDVPVLPQDGVKIRIPLGHFAGQRSPLRPPTEVALLDISMEAGSELRVPVAPGQCVFLMPIHGATHIDGTPYALDALRVPVYPAQAEEHWIHLRAEQGASKIVLFSGAPLQA